MSEVSELLEEWDLPLLLDEEIRPVRGARTAKTAAKAHTSSRLRAALMEKDGIFRRTTYTTRSKLE